MKIQTRSILSLSALICMVGAVPDATAVVPAPDGCYPNYTTAEGCNALNFLSTGAGNTGVGWYSLYLDTSGNFNTGLGGGALALNNADSNTAVGAGALLLNTTGTQNVALGTDALVFNDSGGFNSAVGAFALYHNTGNANTAVGWEALFFNDTGVSNTAVGAEALLSNIDGFNNTAIGQNALPASVSGLGNTAIGRHALFNNTGNGNIALGASAGEDLTTGDGNIDIGNGGVANESGIIRIGSGNVQTATFIAGISGAAVTGSAVVVNGNGQLGVAPSSRHFKTEIKPMDKTSEAILALKPVTFRYRKEIDPEGMPQFGLVAEEVEKVNPDLVARNAKGEVYTVRYEAVNAMLLNEFLKEHRKNEEQQAVITALKSAIAEQQKQFQMAIAEQRKEFGARLRQQDAKIQRVNDRIELNRTARQNVVTNE